MLNYIDSCTVPLELCGACLRFLINHLYSIHSSRKFLAILILKEGVEEEKLPLIFSFWGKKNQFREKILQKCLEEQVNKHKKY